MIETPPEALKEINVIIQNFIWEGKTAKIAQKTLLNNIDNRGLKLCYFSFKVDSINVSWIKRLCDDTDADWKILQKFFYDCDDLNIYFKNEPRTAQDILEQSIWITKDIIINNKCIHWKSWNFIYK